MSPHDLLRRLMGKFDPDYRWALREQNPHGIKLTSQIELLKDADKTRALGLSKGLGFIALRPPHRG